MVRTLQRMQNRYAGDVGDFMKFGLLRSLVVPVTADGTELSVGLNWYLAPDEGRNADGKHISYLDVHSRHHSSLRACDPGLMLSLASVVRNGRSVAALEACDALPAGSQTHNEMLRPELGPAGRRAWHQRGLDALAGCDIVFADPDNGIYSGPRRSKLHKFALVDELADYAQRRQSLVVYHHHDRSSHREVHALRRLAELAVGTGQAPVAAVIARRGTCRFFLVSAAEPHRERLATSLRAYARRWTSHAELVWPREFNSGLSSITDPRSPHSAVFQAPSRGRGSSGTAESLDVGLPSMFSDVTGRPSKAGQGKTVQIGYKNRNGQTVIASTGLPGTDHGQSIYVLRCGACAFEYGSNGSDNFQRKCPKCQGGAPGLRYS